MNPDPENAKEIKLQSTGIKMYMKDVCTIVYFVGIFLALLAGAPHISCENGLGIVWTKSNKGTDLLPELLPHGFAFRMNLGMKKRRNAGTGGAAMHMGRWVWGTRSERHEPIFALSGWPMTSGRSSAGGLPKLKFPVKGIPQLQSGMPVQDINK